MKKIVLLITFFSCFILKSYAQSVEGIKALIYIKSYPMKTEDGCGFFSDNIASLEKKKYLLITTVNQITKKQMAYVQKNDGSFIYFTRTSRVATPNGYIDTYKGKNALFKLIIDQIIKKDKYSFTRNGKLELTINNVKKAINIYGRDEEIDRYNNPEYFKH